MQNLRSFFKAQFRVLVSKRVEDVFAFISAETTKLEQVKCVIV